MTAPARPLEVRDFRESDRDAVLRLNQRLRAGGVTDRVEPGAPGAGDQANPTRTIQQRLIVLSDGDEIRGGVWLKEQDFQLGPAIVRMGWAKYPVAESLINPEFAGVPGALLIQLMREQPRLLALGMGGHAGPFARFLAKMRWAGQTVPLLLFPNHPSRVLRQYARLSPSPLRRVLLGLAGASGAADLGFTLRTWQQRGAAATLLHGVEVVELAHFGPEADLLWQRYRSEYGFLAARDARTLNELYPPASSGVIRLLIRRDGRDLGWAVAFHRAAGAPEPQSQFGGLALGVIADGLAAAGDRPTVLAAVHDYLIGRNVDLILSNQSHPGWQEGLRRLGYLTGPERFAFYQSPAVTKALAAIDPLTWYVTRGDCHGGDWQ